MKPAAGGCSLHGKSCLCSPHSSDGDLSNSIIFLSNSVIFEQNIEEERWLVLKAADMTPPKNRVTALRGITVFSGILANWLQQIPNPACELEYFCGVFYFTGFFHVHILLYPSALDSQHQRNPLWCKNRTRMQQSHPQSWCLFGGSCAGDAASAHPVHPMGSSCQAKTSCSWVCSMGAGIWKRAGLEKLGSDALNSWK